jgi:hypothetical protein
MTLGFRKIGAVEDEPFLFGLRGGRSSRGRMAGWISGRRTWKSPRSARMGWWRGKWFHILCKLGIKLLDSLCVERRRGDRDA